MPTSAISAFGRVPWLLLAIVASVLIAGMPRIIYRGDPVTMQYATVNLINEGRIDVLPEHARMYGERGQHFFEHPTNGSWHSKYGVLNILLFAPPLAVERIVAGELQQFHELSTQGQARRCLFLNAYNGLASLALAAYLFAAATQYTTRNRAASQFVLCALFGTFLWHYLRAHTVELFQVLFFTAAFYHLVRASRLRRDAKAHRRLSGHLAASSIFAGLMATEKLVFIPLAPAVVAAGLWIYSSSGERHIAGERCRRRLRRLKVRAASIAFALLLPSVVAACTILWSNWHRFGSPWATGYTQWTTEQQLFAADPRVALWAYAAHPQKSVLLYFPLLAMAVPAMPAFGRKHPLEFGFVAGVFAFYYLLTSSYTSWSGDWCHGPRYFLFALPALSLPALTWWERASRGRAAWCNRALWLATWGVSLWMFSRQYYVQRLEFFAPFRAWSCLDQAGDARVFEYFWRRPHWEINQDLLRHARGEAALPPLELLREKVPPGTMRALDAAVRETVVGNSYWLDSR